MDDQQRQRLAQRIQTIEVPAGNIVIQQGDVGTQCYLIQDGEVEVSQKHGDTTRCLATLGPDCIFGEAALLADAPRNATVRAITPCHLLALSRRDLLDVFSWNRLIGPAFFELLNLRSQPVRRSEITADHYTAADGELITILKDPNRGSYFRLSDLGCFIWERLDGHHNLKDLAIATMATTGNFVPHAIAEIVGGLVVAGFALSPSTKASQQFQPKSPPTFRARVRDLLQWRKLLCHVDPIVSRLYTVFGVRYLFSKIALTVIATIAAAGFVTFTLQTTQFSELRSLSWPWMIATTLLSLLFIVLTHDAGHAFATKYFGREVLGIGIGWNWFSPILFVDTSDMWPKPPLQRIAVHMAGIVVNLFLAGLAALLALMIFPHALLLFSALSYGVVMINLIPRFHSDGEYALADLRELRRTTSGRAR